VVAHGFAQILRPGLERIFSLAYGLTDPLGLFWNDTVAVEPGDKSYNCVDLVNSDDYEFIISPGSWLW
jgi:hypothetical protein